MRPTAERWNFSDSDRGEQQRDDIQCCSVVCCRRFDTVVDIVTADVTEPDSVSDSGAEHISVSDRQSSRRVKRYSLACFHHADPAVNIVAASVADNQPLSDNVVELSEVTNHQQLDAG